MKKIFLLSLLAIFTYSTQSADMFFPYYLSKTSDKTKRHIFSYLEISEYSNLRSVNKDFRRLIDSTDNQTNKHQVFNTYAIINDFFKHQDTPYHLQLKNRPILSIVRYCLKSMLHQNSPDVSILNVIAVNYFISKEDAFKILASMTYKQFLDYNSVNISMLKEIEYENLETESGTLSAYFKENSEHILVLHTHEIEIKLNSRQIPNNLKHLALTGDVVTTIGDLFLNGYSDLKFLDLSFLNQIATIRDYFLYWCPSLTSLSLSFLNQATSIGDHFLSFCWGLTYLDLSPLSQVVTIGSYFLYGCSGLTSINLSPLNKVTTIGCVFLYGCSGLRTIYLSENMRDGIIHHALIKSKLQEKIIFQ